MKFATVLLIAFLAIGQSRARIIADKSSSEEKSKLDADEVSCMKELHFDEEKAVHFSETDDVTPEERPEYTKFITCYGQKKGFLDEAGHVDYDGIGERLMAEINEEDPGHGLAKDVFKRILNNAIEKCRTEQSTDTEIEVIIKNALSCVSGEVDKGAKKFTDD